MTSPSLVLNQTQVSKLLGVSPKAVQAFDREGLADAARLGMDGREARYDAAAAVAWLVARKEQAVRDALVPTKLDRLKARKLELEVIESETRLAVQQEELIPMDVFESALGDCLTRLRDTIISFGSGTWVLKLAELSAREVSSAIRQEMIPEMLAALRRNADDLDEEAGDGA